ncbi:MAG: YecA family protein [Fusobacteriaceae bacterium]
MQDKILSTTLNAKNKEELTEILSFFDVKVPKSILKKILLEKTIETLEVQNKKFLKIFSKETQLFINKFITSDLKMKESVVDKKFDCIYELDFFGLISNKFDFESEEKFFELSKSFSENFYMNCNTASGKKELKVSDELEKLLSGIIRFYGVIKEKDFYKIVIKNYPELPEDEIKMFMEKRFSLKFLFNKIFNAGTNEFFYFSDFVIQPEKLMRKFFLRPQLEYKILTKEEYQNFWKLDYCEETKEFLALESFFKKQKLTKIDAKHKVLDLILEMRNGTAFGEIFQEVISSFEFNSKENIDIFATTLQSLYNNIQQWELKGHTPEEVFNMKSNFQPIIIQRKSDKISRNGVCPCGSGKKYKKCCRK